MEYAVINNNLSETPETRKSKGLSTVCDALANLLNTESRGAYLMHYDQASLSAIMTAIEATSEDRAESQIYYKSLNRPIDFHLISIKAETRSKSESDMIQKLIDMPPHKIFKAVKMLSV